MTEEKRFENKVKQFLKDEGCYFVKHFANAFTKSGIPDLLVCCNGYFVGVEIKATNGKPSPLQIHNLKQIDKAGGSAILLYPQDFELFTEFIRHLKGYCFNSYLYKRLKERWWNLAIKSQQN